MVANSTNDHRSTSAKNLSYSGAILLISCYELGHQPIGIASPSGFLRQAGYSPAALDYAIDGISETRIKQANLICISVPMHTALRLGIKLAERIRGINPGCHICFFGLYASLNSEYLLQHVADSIIGGEFEASLVNLAEAIECGKNIAELNNITSKHHQAAPQLVRLNFALPDRSSLPTIDKYARLEYKGKLGLAGYVEASRGCLHLCTHCPIPPVYEGRFFVVPKQVVIDDIRTLVEAGASHITFGDPDFLNGPNHSMRIIEEMHSQFPQLTFDFTAKVEHILKYPDIVKEMGRSGCIFIVSALESVSDEVLARLVKGHTRTDIVEALKITRDAGITLRPSFVAFTPWTTFNDYVEMLKFIEEHSLIEHVDPVQYAIRLLIPPASLILENNLNEPWLGELDQAAFSYRWNHPDPKMDALHRSVNHVVEAAAQSNSNITDTFYKVAKVVEEMLGSKFTQSRRILPLATERPPRLTESWFCCAEPTEEQLNALKCCSHN
ncbi:MAG TPA: CUAEP/CCAEP-tail radical SAM protein [Blastocatellia bacterium]|nr:CUAEP/CCAEP-tail radical SAM protein [Blastocatellia bacterium]